MMPHRILLLLLLFLLLAAASAQESRQPDFSIIPPTAPSTSSQQRVNTDTTAIASSSSAPAQAAAPPLYQEILSLHNSYRADHGAPPMVWDAILAESAARVASSCNFKHSGLADVGENLAAFWDRGSTHNSKPAEALAAAVNNWYNEVQYYNFSNPGFYQNYAAGHFTQVVWVASTRLGCAAVFCNGNFQVDPSWVSGPPPKSADMVVCHYAPPGNMVDGGQEVYFQQNVLPKAPKNPSPPEVPSPSPSPSPTPSPNPSSTGPNKGPTLLGSSLAVGQSISTGSCLFSGNRLYRLCLNAFGEITVMNGPSSNKVRWRTSMPLGTRGSNRPPYTLSLNSDYTVTVSNGDNRLLSMIALPEIPTGTVSLKLRNDGKAAVVDAAGKCIVAWGSGPGMQPGC